MLLAETVELGSGLVGLLFIILLVVLILYVVKRLL